jgi:allantoinase
MLSSGEISFVASDHSPSPPSMKQGTDFFKIWGGIAGVQSTRSAMLTLDAPRLEPDMVAEYTASNIANRFEIRKARIAAGFEADLSIVDVGASYTLTRDMLLDRHKLSPYVGRTFRGVVKRTIVRGHTVFRDGKIVAGKFRGRLVKPERRKAAGRD